MPASSVQSVERALRVLDILREAPASVSSLGEALGITAPGATKILRTLEEMGLVRRGANRTYRLAAGVCGYARAYLRQVGLTEAARPALLDLSRATGNHTILAVLEGVDQVNVLRVDASRGWQHPDSELPERVGPALPQATGRVLLAHVSPGVLAAHLDAYPLARYGGGLNDVAALAAELAAIRRQGHAVVSPSCRDVQFVAAPVQAASGTVLAAAGAHVRPNQDVNDTVRLVREAAAVIARELGTESRP